jgi:hypothetical protein
MRWLMAGVVRAAFAPPNRRIPSLGKQLLERVGPMCRRARCRCGWAALSALILAVTNAGVQPVQRLMRDDYNERIVGVETGAIALS